MRTKWLIMLAILVGGWGLLEVMLWSADLGDYAQNPQQIRLQQGSTAIVGGGRAGLVFQGSPHRRRAEILVRCKDVTQEIRLRRDEISEEICGIQVRFLELEVNGKALVLVSWQE
jgi:hypothetical protein